MFSRRAFLAQVTAAAQPPVKITGIRVTPVRLAKRFTKQQAPKWISDYDPRRWRYNGPFAQLNGAIAVEIETSAGITGYGLGGGGGAAKYVIDHHLADLLIGANALNVELLWDQMYSSTLLYGRRGLVIMALSGIDLALWDIAGKAAGKPVHQLLGGAVKEKVPSYYTNADFETGKRLGAKAFKIPVKYGPREGRDGMRKLEQELAAARKGIGDDAELMIDCICTWDVPHTLEMAKRLEPLRLSFIEEPISPDDIDGYELLCREVKSTRIACGEHVYTRFEYQQYLKQNATHILQPDLTWCGGLTEGRRIAAMASARNLPVIPHRGGSAFAMSLIVSSPNCPLAESFGIEEDDNELMIAMRPRFEKGYFYPPEGPGFGMSLTAGLIRKHAQ